MVLLFKIDLKEKSKTTSFGSVFNVNILLTITNK